MPQAIAGALAAIGVGASTAAVAANVIVGLALSALSMGLQALIKPRPNKPTISGRREQLQSSIREPTRAREVVVGKVRKGGTILFWESANNNKDYLLWIAFAGTEVQALDEVYFFDELGIDQNGVVRPKFKNLVRFEKFLGTADQTASQLLQDATPKWTVNHRNRGVAGMAFILQREGDVFATGLPNITVVVRGAKMYDTRDGTTSYKNNAALVTAFHLNHPIYGLGAAYGTVIDENVLNAAANVCDEDVPIKAGHTLQFDGIDDIIDFGNVLNQTGAITIEARVYPTDDTGGNFLYKDNGTHGFGLQQLAGGAILFFVRDLSSVNCDTPTSTLVQNTWQDIAGVWNPPAGTLTVYRNGSQVAQVTSVTGTPVINSATLKAFDGFTGRAQEVRLWGEARTPTAISAFKDKSLTGTEDNLLGYWPLTEKKDLRAEDATETANDGTITGAVWVRDDSVIGTEKRYTANGVIFSDQLPRDIIEDLLSSMVGSAVPSGGKWLIRAGAFETPTVGFDEDDARDSITVQPRRPRRELFNSVRGTYLAPENDWQPADFPIITNATFEAEDGGVRITQDIELPFTSTSSGAQRIGWLTLLRNREQLSCTYPVNLRGLRVRGGDYCTISNNLLGWDGKPFEVIKWNFVTVDGENGIPAFGFDLETRETSAAIYDFNPATDEVPINPSPNTNLPSPFSQIAMISDFVNRSGFQEIVSPDQNISWPGTISGFTYNPLTGHLVPNEIGAADDDSVDIFDYDTAEFEPSPFYESPEIDIEFSDTIRTYTEGGFIRMPLQTGRIGIRKFYDSKVEAGDEYEGWKEIFNTVKVTGRYFKHRIEFDFRDSAAVLTAFTPIIDKMTVHQWGNNETIPVGGKEFEFPQPYHNLPSMSWSSHGASVRLVQFTDVTKTSFAVSVFDNDADDSGGVIDWQSAGV